MQMENKNPKHFINLLTTVFDPEAQARWENTEDTVFSPIPPSIGGTMGKNKVCSLARRPGPIWMKGAHRHYIPVYLWHPWRAGPSINGCWLSFISHISVWDIINSLRL